MIHIQCKINDKLTVTTVRRAVNDDDYEKHVNSTIQHKYIQHSYIQHNIKMLIPFQSVLATFNFNIRHNDKL